MLLCENTFSVIGILVFELVLQF